MSQRKSSLRAEVKALESALQRESLARLDAVNAASVLRQRLDRLLSLAEELEASRREFESRRAAAGSSVQATANDESDAKPTATSWLAPRPPRSCRRTAYCTDYSGRHLIGNGCERVERARNAMRIHPTPTAVVAATEEKESMPTQKPTRPSTATMGKPSHMDLNAYRRRSARRTKYYVDYLGRRISMDPGDWPGTDGAILC